MSLILHADAYTHVPQADVQISNSPIMDEDGKHSIGTKTTWTIAGTIIGTSIANIKTKLTALEAAYETPTELTLKDGATTYETLDGATAKDGLVVDGISYPEGNKAEYATKRRYNVTVYGDFYDGGEAGDPEILWLQETTSYSWDQHDKYTRSVNGSLRTAEGVSASGKYATVTPTIPAGTNRMSYSREINDDNDQMSYSFTDQEYWYAWPALTTEGRASTSREDGANGLQRVAVQGSFRAPNITDASIAALSYKLNMPQYKPIKESAVVSAFDGSVSFSYEYIDLVNSDTDLIEWRETSALEGGAQDFVTLEALDGDYPEKQQTVRTATRAMQSGTAVGANGWPAFPPYLYAASNLKPPIVESMTGPERMPNGEYSNYAISWNYEYLFAYDEVIAAPNTA